MHILELNIEEKKKLYISQFDLSPRCHKALMIMEVETLGKLIDMTRSDVFKFQNIGKKTVEEIDRLLLQNGLAWKEEEKKIPIKISKTPLIESELIKIQEKIKKENKKLRDEVELLRDVKFKDNLEKLRMEGKIKELEERLEFVTLAMVKK